VLATTSIIGDVVGRVGGESIDLAVLMQPGQDPHSYQPGAADLSRAADADIIFVNGWDLEEALIADLTAISGQAVMVPVSAGIEPLTMDGQVQGTVNPHVWLDVVNVVSWVDSIRTVLVAADPANAGAYDANATAYRAELKQLDAEVRRSLETIPAEQRVLVTNHDNLGYFAAAYGFEIIGTVVPSVSTLAEPTAGGLGELVEQMRAEDVCAIVTESTTSDQLIRALASELSHCPQVHTVSLYTDSLGPASSGAGSYAEMMAVNAANLVAGLTR
jgi:ABC-type Zn uptake system ZnuABC Zn-binding protein ZnuA